MFYYVTKVKEVKVGSLNNIAPTVLKLMNINIPDEMDETLIKSYFMLNINIDKLKIKSQGKELVNLSFKIENSTALIGESGSGKSLTLKALLNLLPASLNYEKEIESNFTLDFDSIAFIPQNPFTSLSPMTKIDKQFFCSNTRKEEVLKLVDLDIWVLNKYPNQLSGGQIQRIIIAIALSKKINFCYLMNLQLL